MRLVRSTWLRFAVWVVFLVLVAVAAAVAHLGAWVILGVMAAAWLLVAVVELLVSRLPAPGRPRRVVVAPAVAEEAAFEHVRVLPREPERVFVEPEPEPTAAEPEPEPVGVGTWPERVSVAPEPEPEPVFARPEPEPEPLPEPVAEPVAEEAPPVAEPPRSWNLWLLEQLTRDAAGADVARDEEREFLLVYLRDFASPDGQLPRDFDSLVRESFGELLAAAAP